MYSYTNKRKLSKKKVFLSLTCLFVAGVAYFTYDYMNKQSQAAPVFKEESLPVLALPDSVKKIGLPFQVEATTALDFFDGKQGDIESMTLFEGVYRGNQGMDYTFGEEAFEVVSCYDGKVSEVKDDPIFGQSVSVAYDDVVFTYQSLSEVLVKTGDEIKNGEVIGKAGKNIYNKELGNHLHIVVTKGGQIRDPESVYGKTIEELK